MKQDFPLQEPHWCFLNKTVLICAQWSLSLSVVSPAPAFFLKTDLPSSQVWKQPGSLVCSSLWSPFCRWELQWQLASPLAVTVYNEVTVQWFHTSVPSHFLGVSCQDIKIKILTITYLLDFIVAVQFLQTDLTPLTHLLQKIPELLTPS